MSVNVLNTALESGPLDKEPSPTPLKWHFILCSSRNNGNSFPIFPIRFIWGSFFRAGRPAAGLLKFSPTLAVDIHPFFCYAEVRFRSLLRLTAVFANSQKLKLKRDTERSAPDGVRARGFASSTAASYGTRAILMSQS